MSKEDRDHDFSSQFDRRLNRLEGIVTAQAATLEHMNRTLTDIADRVHSPRQTNWGWLLSAVTVVLMLAGGYTTVITKPIDSRLSVNEQVDIGQNHILAERGGLLGGALEKLNSHERWMNEREPLDERVASAEAYLDQLEKRVQRLEHWDSVEQHSE